MDTTQYKYTGLSLQEAFDLCRLKVQGLDKIDLQAFRTNSGHVGWVQETCDEIKALAGVCEMHVHDHRENRSGNRK